MEFVARHGATSRYTSEWSRWHLWDGNLWRPDEKRRVFSMAQEVCRDAARKANTILSGKTRAQVVSLTGEHPLIATAPREWDRDPWLLGTPGGVVDLRTGELRPGDPILMVTKSTSVAPGGDCPLWRKTLDDIFKEDREVIAFAKRHAGYLLTGSIKKEKLVFALGDGGNGKGTVFETLAYVMGEYAMSCPIETLVQTHGSQHPTEIVAVPSQTVRARVGTGRGAPLEHRQGQAADRWRQAQGPRHAWRLLRLRADPQAGDNRQ